ncbi:MAG: response regulator [Chitinophagaceae bacterium]|nr:response regulator [Chitinophagaceae bacterium]
MKHILVVDDEVDVQVLFEQRFRKEIRNGEIAFSFAFNADDAIAFLIHNVRSISLILSDINMPGKSGLDLLARVKKEFTNPPPVMVMITAYGDDTNYQQAKSLGADDFFTKPVDFIKLKERINNF